LIVAEQLADERDAGEAMDVEDEGPGTPGVVQVDERTRKEPDFNEVSAYC
jgi:hypothetical protein